MHPCNSYRDSKPYLVSIRPTRYIHCPSSSQYVPRRSSIAPHEARNRLQGRTHRNNHRLRCMQQSVNLQDNSLVKASWVALVLVLELVLELVQVLVPVLVPELVLELVLESV